MSTKDVIELLFGSGILITLVVGIFKLGEFKNKFDTLEEDLEKFIGDAKDWYKEVYSSINDHATRISIMEVGKSNSPISLRDQFLQFVTDPKLDKQIEEKKTELIDWLKKQNVKTGIDAQDKIIVLVSTGKIEKYLDLTEYKQNLYEKGKTSRDAMGILAVYLFDILIPELDFKKTK